MHFTRKAAPLLGLATLAALGLVAPSHAQKVVTVTGKLTSVENSNGGYNSSVVVGDTYTYTFTVDPAQTQTYSGTSPGNYSYARYNSTGKNYAATVTFDGMTFTGDSTSQNDITKQDGLGAGYQDLQYQQSNNGSATGLSTGWSAFVSYVEGYGAGGSVSPNLNDPSADWEKLTSYNKFFYNEIYNSVTSGHSHLSGSIDTVTVSDLSTTAPEPSSVAAFAFTGLGAAGLILRARKRSVAV